MVSRERVTDETHSAVLRTLVDAVTLVQGPQSPSTSSSAWVQEPSKGLSPSRDTGPKFLSRPKTTPSCYTYFRVLFLGVSRTVTFVHPETVGDDVVLRDT